MSLEGRTEKEELRRVMRAQTQSEGCDCRGGAQGGPSGGNVGLRPAGRGAILGTSWEGVWAKGADCAKVLGQACSSPQATRLYPPRLCAMLQLQALVGSVWPRVRGSLGGGRWVAWLGRQGERRGGCRGGVCVGDQELGTHALRQKAPE